MKITLSKLLALTLVATLYTGCSSSSDPVDPVDKTCTYTPSGTISVTIDTVTTQPVVTATSNENDEAVTITTTGTIDYSTIGQYILTSTSDSCDNDSTYTVNVIPVVVNPEPESDLTHDNILPF